MNRPTFEIFICSIVFRGSIWKDVLEHLATMLSSELSLSELSSGLQQLLWVIALTVLPIGHLLMELPIALTLERGFL